MLETKNLRINLTTFDLVKGSAMLFIILGHKLSYYNLNKVELLGPILPIVFFLQYGINPMFFMIAGLGFKRQPTGKFLKKTFSDLMKPYFYVMIAYAVCFPIIHHALYGWWPGAITETIRFLLAFVLGLPKPGKIFLGYELYECTIVWFFLSLFIAQNILNQISRIKKEITQTLIVFVCFLTGYLLSRMEFNYYCIPQGLLGVGYCYAGYLIKKHTLYKSKRLPWICVGLALISAWESAFGDFSMGYGVFKYGFVECIMAGCSGMLALLLGIVINQFEWKCLAPLRSVGTYTYWIMCIHAVEMCCIPWYRWSAAMAEHPFLGYWMEVLFSALIITVGCLVLKKIAKYKYNTRRAKQYER